MQLLEYKKVLSVQLWSFEDVYVSQRTAYLGSCIAVIAVNKNIRQTIAFDNFCYDKTDGACLASVCINLRSSLNSAAEIVKKMYAYKRRCISLTQKSDERWPLSAFEPLDLVSAPRVELRK